MAALSELNAEDAWVEIQEGRCVLHGFTIDEDDVEIRRVEREGYAATTLEGGQSLVLDMTLNNTLLSMGLAREIIRRVQQKRKELDLDVEASITLNVWLSEGNPVLSGDDWVHVQSEVRASSAVLDQGGVAPEGADAFEVDGSSIHFTVG
jgi:isoleucyl-tRNA synthetase